MSTPSPLHPAFHLLMLALIFTAPGGSGIADDGSREHDATLPRQHESIFRKYCLDCHDAETQEGSVNLDAIDFNIAADIRNAELWAKVLNAINSGEMPPAGSTPVSDSDKLLFLGDLSTRMVAARKILSDSGGVITLRRLNRREYANTIESLLGVRPRVDDLPDDQATSGFDTQGASLFISSEQIEQYLATARATLELAILPRKHAKFSTVHVEPEDHYNAHYGEAAAELADKEARAAAYFAQSDKPPSAFGFLDEYQVKKQREQEWLPQLRQYLARPETRTGATLIMTIKQGGYTRIKLPAIGAHSDGHYKIRLRAAAYPDAAERLHYLEFCTVSGRSRTRLGWRKITAPLNDPQIIEFPYVHRPGEKISIEVHQRSHQDRGDKNLAAIDQRANGFGTPPGIWIDWAELAGPTRDSKPRQIADSIVFERPGDWDEMQHVQAILKRFAVRAFRDGQPSEEYLTRLTKHYQAERSKGKGFLESLIHPLSIILASPDFLYMVEATGDKESERLTGPELAVRLAYFLWSSPPDEELMRLARNGGLNDPTSLRRQTTRLLADARADEFIRGFVHQWLHMDRLGMFQFDGVQFPTFDNAARESAREEIFQTVHHLLKEKLPLPTLLQSDFVVINDLLAGYYGIPGVVGHQFRKVKVPEGSLRGGLLGTAAVLAMGSDGQRASAVERGAWVLRKLLNAPPPPAPPNIPQLSRLAGKVLSARELAQAHQEQPQCANCHQKIDPIGFGLENFDAVGLWRDEETIITQRAVRTKKRRTISFPIDPAGTLPGGQTFDDYFGLRDAVATHADDFATGFTEAIITYGLGRPYGFTDKDLADEILTQARSQNYEISSFIHALVQSPAFQGK